ncbi:hypothetical protein FDK12_07840 [Arthrobacter sp. NamB2]|uniref:hypothetical protein n=1 Tax=Arthrobacter sp. NamB2 TaxID=2576035 RepID=UPI0010C9A70A|nr:hypothetical protein [Arthrobacter sp. NamB2]TKV28560.1 hypothetical protein FDK12_07840 [Arthrobacter sp. NamB2]
MKNDDELSEGLPITDEYGDSHGYDERDGDGDALEWRDAKAPLYGPLAKPLIGMPSSVVTVLA